jgi:hypothetical protein
MLKPKDKGFIEYKSFYFGFWKVVYYFWKNVFYTEKSTTFQIFSNFGQTYNVFPQKPYGKNALYIKILIEIAKALK